VCECTYNQGSDGIKLLEGQCQGFVPGSRKDPLLTLLLLIRRNRETRERAAPSSGIEGIEKKEEETHIQVPGFRVTVGSQGSPPHLEWRTKREPESKGIKA
jgi:hypothetical protein